VQGADGIDDAVDLALDVDIEGAELELFTYEAEAWLGRAKLIAVETHDRFRPGSEAAVRDALVDSFEELPWVGEEFVFSPLRRLNGGAWSRHGTGSIDHLGSG
jgi:hypothetical protein